MIQQSLQISALCIFNSHLRKEAHYKDPKFKMLRVSRPQPHAHRRDRSNVQRAAQRPGAPVRAEAGPQ